jgi:protein MpaA
MIRRSLAWLMVNCFWISNSSFAHTEYSPILNRAFIKSGSINPENSKEFLLEESRQVAEIARFCQQLGLQFRRHGWESDPCGSVKWQATTQTVDKRPLLYVSFGKGNDTTLLLSGVHPNELTPVPMGFRLAKHLAEHPQLLKPDQRVVIAPLINPDGFFLDRPSRTNRRGVDPNRNFFTLDWYEKSLSWWQSGRNKNLAYFPGHFPNSEIETIFQVRLIDDFQPDKILSIHAPLGFLDYDGPGDQKPSTLTTTETQARMLAAAISKKANNYRVVDYSFYPGSLGNFAGNERHIPTVTLELGTTNAKKVDEYWGQFLPGMLEAIDYPFKKSVEAKINTFKFYSHYEPLAITPKDRS